MHERSDHRGAKRDRQEIDQALSKIHRQLSLTMLGIASFSIASAVALTGEIVRGATPKRSGPSSR